MPNKQKKIMGQLKQNLRFCTPSSVWVAAATSKLLNSRYDIFHTNFRVKDSWILSLNFGIHLAHKVFHKASSVVSTMIKFFKDICLLKHMHP